MLPTFHQSLSTHFHKFSDVCWERDGAQIEARRRVDARDIGEEEQQRDGPVPPQPFGRKGVAGDLFVSSRRRCPCIVSSSSSRARLASPIRKRNRVYEREYLAATVQTALSSVLFIAGQ